jgi:hypothetical protein
MSFGLTNASAVMQRLIDQVLSPFKSFALAEMNIIVIFSTSFEEHLRHVTSVLDALRQHYLAIKPSQCRFNQLQARRLTRVHHYNNWTIDRPAYICAATDFPSSVMRFCGLTGFTDASPEILSFVSARCGS